MNVVKGSLNYWLSRFGWPMVAGLLLMIVAAIFYFGVGMPAQRHYEVAKLDATKMQAVFAKRQQDKVSASPATAIATYYRLLPSEKDTPDLMERLFDAAFDNDLVLDHGSFKLVRETDAAISRYLVILPAQGTYPNVRKFMNRVLNELPSASLDQVSFHREDIHDEDVNVDFKFTVYLNTTGRI